MRFASWSQGAVGPVIATSIHAGHDLRPEIEALMAADEATRLRQEDPHTDEIAAGIDCRVVVHRSRFEVDVNRPRSDAVYRRPEQAWGIELWRTEPYDDVVARSQRLYDGFYRRLSRLIERAIDIHGGFVIYDVHSYNHRTAGPTSPPAPAVDNPLVNLGTGFLPERWRPAAAAFVATMRQGSLGGESIDTRENVRFRGGHLSRYLAERYGSRGGALAIEFRKDFMDEWTGQCDRGAVAELSAALAATTGPVWEAHLRCR
jgi:N-formylglutamate amidohydrolase